MFLLSSVDSGEKDSKELKEYRVQYDVITTWIIENEKRLEDLKDFESKDPDDLRDQQKKIEVKYGFNSNFN